MCVMMATIINTLIVLTTHMLAIALSLMLKDCLLTILMIERTARKLCPAYSHILLDYLDSRYRIKTI
jgi:hypothetical protein